LTQLLQTRSNGQLQKKSTPIPTIERQASYELSNAQRRLWVPDQVEENLVSYNMPFAYHLKGKLNVPAVERALERIIHRHEILRTRLVQQADGTPRQVIDAPTPFQLTYYNWENKPEAEVLRYIAEDHAHYRFDLAFCY